MKGLRLEGLPDEWFEYSRALQLVMEFYGNFQLTNSEDGAKTEESSADRNVSGQLYKAQVCILIYMCV